MTCGNDITLCLTAGGRPDLLEKTLHSLLAANSFAKIIIANDFGDEASTSVAKRLCPDATIIHHKWRQGQLATVDEMYSLVETQYIFHCEDDWEFDRVPFLNRCMDALHALENVSVVSVRSSACLYRHFGNSPYEHLGEPTVIDVGGTTAMQLKIDDLESWASFTFNPSLTRRAAWKSIGGFNSLNDEHSIDLRYRAKGLTTVYLVPGFCHHIGDDRHIHDPFLPVGEKSRDHFRIAKTWARQAVRRIVPFR